MTTLLLFRLFERVYPKIFDSFPPTDCLSVYLYWWSISRSRLVRVNHNTVRFEEDLWIGVNSFLLSCPRSSPLLYVGGFQEDDTCKWQQEHTRCS